MQQELSDQKMEKSEEIIPLEITEDPSLQKYKAELLKIVLGVFFICVVIIIERIFFDALISEETDLLEKLQNNLGIVTQKENDSYVTFNGNFFLTIIGAVEQFEINFMAITSIFIAFYVGINAVLATKVTFVTILGYILITCMQLLYAGPRPFWSSSLISAPICLQSYTQPSKDVFITLFMIFYFTFCMQNAQQNESQNSSPLLVRLILMVLALCYFFMRYMLGQAYITGKQLNYDKILIEMVIACLYFILFYYSVVFLDNYVDDLIRKSAFISQEAKRYVFYWFFWCILFEVIASMLYSGSEEFVSIDWIQNYIYCLKSKGNLPVGVPYDELIGPWFTFLNTTCIFGLIGGVFGVAHCFRHMNEFDWFKGDLKQRVIRIFIAQAFLIPSWVLVILQSSLLNTEWVRLSGLNAYFLNSFHFLILYFWLFGLMPLYVYKKLNLTNISIPGQAGKDQSFGIEFDTSRQQPANEKPFMDKGL